MFSIKHFFQSPKTDGPDTTLVKPSNWNADHVMMASAGGVYVGRDITGPGPMQELPISGIVAPAARFEASAPWQYGFTSLLSLAIDQTVYNHGAGTFNPTGNPDDGGFVWTPGAGLWAIQTQTFCVPTVGEAPAQLFVVKYPAAGGEPEYPGGWAGWFFLNNNNTAQISTLVEMKAGDRLSVLVALGGSAPGFNFSEGPYTFLSGYRVRPAEAALTG